MISTKRRSKQLSNLFLFDEPEKSKLKRNFVRKKWLPATGWSCSATACTGIIWCGPRLANSPDLSPLGYCIWSTLKAKAYSEKRTIFSIIQEWCMSIKRLRLVVEARGGNIQEDQGDKQVSDSYHSCGKPRMKKCPKIAEFFRFSYPALQSGWVTW